jgi:hypothetical protein
MAVLPYFLTRSFSFEPDIARDIVAHRHIIKVELRHASVLCDLSGVAHGLLQKGCCSNKAKPFKRSRERSHLLQSLRADQIPDPEEGQLINIQTISDESSNIRQVVPPHELNHSMD